MKSLLIGVDLDGTLLTNSKTVSEKTVKTIEEACKAGHVVVPVTGRPLGGVFECVLNIPGVDYAITSNGAIVTELSTGKALIENNIDGNTCLEIYEKLKDFNPVFEVFIKGYGYETKESINRVLKRIGEKSPLVEYVNKSRKACEDIPGLIKENLDVIDELALIFETDMQAEIAISRLEELTNIKVIKPAPGEIEIYADCAGKGIALQEFAYMLGIEKQNIVAIGDGVNDIEMLEHAGIAIAMGNAGEEVKKIADIVTLDNENDGVARAIEEFISLKYVFHIER